MGVLGDPPVRACAYTEDTAVRGFLCQREREDSDPLSFASSFADPVLLLLKRLSAPTYCDHAEYLSRRANIRQFVASHVFDSSFELR